MAANSSKPLISQAVPGVSGQLGGERLGRAVALALVCGALVALPVLGVFGSFWDVGATADTLFRTVFGCTPGMAQTYGSDTCTLDWIMGTNAGWDKHNLGSHMVATYLNILAGFESETAGQAELQSRAFDSVEELRDQRGARLVMARRTPPAVLWAILIGGGAAVLAVAAASSLGGGLRATYVALLAAVIAFALFAIYALSHPLRSGLAAETASLLEHVPRTQLRPD